jgi:two-component system, OmpR family, response regulator
MQPRMRENAPTFRDMEERAGMADQLMRLLLVEDDAKLVRALERGLGREGYAVDVARTGDEALEQAQASGAEYDAIVLDIMLPGPDGFEVCRKLRESEHWVPVLMLTARTEVGDRIRGLDAGADDYLVKPFDFGELLARLRALTRRTGTDQGGGASDLALDPATKVVTHEGREVELTATEFALLDALMRNRGEVVTRDELLARVWDGDRDLSPNIVDVYVGYLRRKLEQPSGTRLIRTVRGVGFLLEPR